MSGLMGLSCLTGRGRNSGEMEFMSHVYHWHFATTPFTRKPANSFWEQHIVLSTIMCSLHRALKCKCVCVLGASFSLKPGPISVPLPECSVFRGLS